MIGSSARRGSSGLTNSSFDSRVGGVQESEQMSLPFEAEDVVALQEAREEALQAEQQERLSRRSRTVKQGRRSRVHELPSRLEEGLTLISGLQRACKLVPTEVQKKPLDYDEQPLDEARDVSERLEFEGACFSRTRYNHPRYLKKGETPGAYYVTCRLPSCTMGNSAVGDTLLVYAICNKFCERLPLYRQLKFFSDHGLVGVDEKMLSCWMQKAAEALNPLYELFYQTLQESETLQVYEAPTGDIRDRRPIGHMRATRCAATGRVHYSWLEELSVAVPERGEVLDTPPVAHELFVSAPGEGTLSALFYTLIGECERCGLDFGEWLLTTLQVLPGYKGALAELLPKEG